MNAGQGIKVVVSMIGLDGHSTGAEIVSRILMDAGMEVVYLGYYNTAETIVQTAMQEDADVIGISSHGSNYSQIGELVDLLRKKDMANYPSVYMYIAPFIGVVMYFLSYAFWRYSLRYYKSTGN